MLTSHQHHIRRSAQTHPWINFDLDLSRLTYRTWLLLGEAQSKLQHIAGVPLKPAFAEELNLIYLSKGVHGTTSIEGNTLSEDEVLERVAGQLELPISQEYLGREIDNILEAYNGILSDLLNGRREPLTRERLEMFNRLVLRDLPVSDDVKPGVLRTHSVAVANYRGAPAEDLDHLLDRLCDWLETGFDVSEAPHLASCIPLIKAVMAHLYLAWIHPFGDGNGRTARLMEFQILIESGIPVPASHLLSDHYNRTRQAYYRALDRTSRVEGYPIEEFIHYAVEGLVDELREQVQRVRRHQMDVTWENHVHDLFRDQDTPAKRRQRHIVLDLPANDPTPTSKVRQISARVATEYAAKTQKTVTRDLNALARMKLIRRVRGGIIPNRQLVEAFLPSRASAD